METFKRVMPVLAVAGGASVAVMNLSHLVPTNPQYEYAWWKVAAAALVLAWGSAALVLGRREERWTAHEVDLARRLGDARWELGELREKYGRVVRASADLLVAWEAFDTDACVATVGDLEGRAAALRAEVSEACTCRPMTAVHWEGCPYHRGEKGVEP